MLAQLAQQILFHRERLAMLLDEEVHTRGGARVTTPLATRFAMIATGRQSVRYNRQLRRQKLDLNDTECRDTA
jgi:hypothetical protein